MHIGVMRYFCACAVVIICCFAFNYLWRSESHGDGLAVDQAVEFSIIPYSATIVPFEPVYVNLVWKNTSDGTIGFVPPDTERLAIECMGEKRAEFRCNYVGSPTHFWEERALKVGEEYINMQVIFDLTSYEKSDSNVAFVTPGEYHIRGVYRPQKTKKLIYSKPAEIQVSAAGPDDIQGSRIFSELAVRKMVHGYASDEGAKMLTAFSAEYPNGRLSDHAHYLLGRHFSAEAFSRKYSGQEYEKSAWESYRHFSVITDKNAGLKIDALFNIIDLTVQYDGLRTAAMLQAAHSLLTDRYAKAESLGLKGQADEYLTKLNRHLQL